VTNLKKVTFLGLFIASIAMGSDMRINALGGNAGFWPGDDQNIYLFPATLNNFQLAQVNGVTEDGTSNAVFLFGDKTKYGFMLDGSGDDMINMAWGNGKLGVLLSFDLNSGDIEGISTGEPDEYGYSDTTITMFSSGNMSLGVNVGLNQSFGELGIAFGMSSDDGLSTASTDDESGMIIGLNLRRAQSLWVFESMLVSFSMVTGSAGDATSSDMGLNLDLFNHWTLTENTDLLFALGFGFYSGSDDNGISGDGNVVNTETAILFPKSTFAVETSITDWATARVGVVNSHLLSSSMDDGAGNDDSKTSSMGGSDFGAVFGLGFNYGGFTLDMDLNPGFYTDPVKHITGFNVMNSLGSTASITYTW
jgi:hypothetical protein